MGKVNAKAPGGLNISLDLNENLILTLGPHQVLVEYIGNIGRKMILNVKGPKEVRIDSEFSNYRKRQVDS